MSGFDPDRFYDSEFDQHMAAAAATRDALKEPFARLVEVCATSVRNGGKILFFGNGGSAGDAQNWRSVMSATGNRSRQLP